MNATFTPVTAPPRPCIAAVDDYSVVRAVAYISDNGAPARSQASPCRRGTDDCIICFGAGRPHPHVPQALTLDHARRLRAGAACSMPPTRSACRGRGGCVTWAMSPGQWKARGEGLTLTYGFHPSPFGTALVMATGRGLAGLAFADAGEESEALDDMRRRWPRAEFREDTAGTTALARRIFEPKLWQRDRPLRVVMIGTDFEVRVWETLLKVPMGRATTYSDIATHVRAPKAARAVGAAVGKNPISFVVPCHRVIGKSGDLTGYHWGLTRKRAMLGWEAGRAGAA
jgi:AraC family transcriptional regulator of adaptative response/methylated-DNA-[protein]-cysteine methyltransferase